MRVVAVTKRLLPRRASFTSTRRTFPSNGFSTGNSAKEDHPLKHGDIFILKTTNEGDPKQVVLYSLVRRKGATFSNGKVHVLAPQMELNSAACNLCVIVVQLVKPW